LEVLDVGFGEVKTNEPIMKDQMITFFDGETLSKSMYQLRRNFEYKDNYLLSGITLSNEDAVLDIVKGKRKAKYVGHSCTPNCSTEDWQIDGENKIGIIAVRDIEAGELLTIDYTKSGKILDQRWSCNCEMENCRYGKKAAKASEVAKNPRKKRANKRFMYSN